MGITERLIEYMGNNNISLEKISQQTKIPITKLKRGGKRSLTAEELCILCTILHIRPEDFYEKQIKQN